MKPFSKRCKSIIDTPQCSQYLQILKNNYLQLIVYCTSGHIFKLFKTKIGFCNMSPSPTRNAVVQSAKNDTDIYTHTLQCMHVHNNCILSITIII